MLNGSTQSTSSTIIQNIMNKNDCTSLNMIQETNEVDIQEEYVNEWIKCRENPLYYILNYVYFQEIGGKCKYDSQLLHRKFRRIIRSVYNHHMAILMASRQLGKALSINTPIPLANGNYIALKYIKVGDKILDHNMTPTKVLATTRVMHNRPCYCIEFSNGESITADKNHIWKISNIEKNLKDELTTTEELFKLYCGCDKLENKIFISHTKDLFITTIYKTNSVPVKCIEVSNLDGMFLCGISGIPTHNSTIASGILSWAANFFPSNRIVIFNFKKDAAQENLRKIRFINDNLPAWMKVPRSSRSDIKTYLELQNGSRIDTFYPSTTTSPDTLSRSLSVPILYVDEAAFIPHMSEIYGSAQPTLSTAREQAARNGYPYMILITSTPNGVEGDGKFFYELYDRAIESDELFYEDEKGVEDWIPDTSPILCDPSKNSYIRVKYHWSENPLKTLEWYEQQKKELNFDQRKINQELDLLFVGGKYCIFDDDTLQKFVSVPKVNSKPLANQAKLDVFINELDPKDYYLIGVDTASSIKGAFNAIEIFSYKEFNQIAEMNVRLGSLTKYGEVVDDLFKWLYSVVGPRIFLCIENNSIGKAIVEHLLYHVPGFNYIPFIYKDFKKKDIPGDIVDTSSYEYGINTNTRSKELMVSLLYDAINEFPNRIKSSELIGQLSSIQRSNRGTIKTSGYSDMFMAACFCAYVRKMTELQILPLLDYSNQQISQSFFNNIQTAAEMMNTKLLIQKEDSPSTIVKTSLEDELLSIQTNTNKIQGEDWRIYMPILSPFD
jgi:ArsR family metal-binding transcriptional regulator